MIRPLTKIRAGRYRSADGRWEFVRDPLDERVWIAYADGDEAMWDTSLSLAHACEKAERTKLPEPGLQAFVETNTNQPTPLTREEVEKVIGND